MPYYITKRLFDFLCACAGLLVLLPLGLVLAIWIKLDDGGPIFFSQIRIGQFGKPFRIWKFRSMVVNAHKLGLAITQAADRRITRVGRLLRQTKLDELPQLWNVLVGNMSLVGPRPEVRRYVKLYTPWQREILRLKPGITDLASLVFRDEESLLRGATNVEQFYIQNCIPKKIELNLLYARRAGLFQDLRIIFLTVGSLPRGAVWKAAIQSQTIDGLSQPVIPPFRSDGSPPDFLPLATNGTAQLPAVLPSNGRRQG